MKVSESPIKANNMAEQVKRPAKLPADVHFFSNHGQKWVGIVGIKGDSPYEVFTGPLAKEADEDGLFIPKSAKNAVVEKRKTEYGESTYDLHFENNRGLRYTIEGIQQVFNPSFWNYSRLVAGMLRYEMLVEDVHRVVSGMYEENETINSWKRGILRILSKYFGLTPTPGVFKDEVPETAHLVNKSTSDKASKGNYYSKSEVCPECGGKMVFDGGCQHCMDCGYSACE